MKKFTKKEIKRMILFFVLSTALGSLIWIFLDKAAGRETSLAVQILAPMLISAPITFLMNDMIETNIR